MLLVSTLTLTFNLQQISADPTQWSIEIINKGDPDDYPISVNDEETFEIVVKVNVTVPQGETGTINIMANTQIWVDPDPPRLVWLIPPNLEESFECSGGTSTHEITFNFSTPDVKREALVYLDIYAGLFQGEIWRDDDYLNMDLKIQPTDDLTVDVRFRAVIEDVYVLWEMYIIAVDVTVTEVLEDPEDFLTVGDYFRVYFDEIEEPLIDMVTIGDHVEVYCDCHLSFPPLIWRPYHYISTPLPTDLNGDNLVDMHDLTIVAMAFGTFPGIENWNPFADFKRDDKIDIRDITKVALDFGKTL